GDVDTPRLGEVVRVDLQALPVGLEGVAAAVAVYLHDLDLLRRCHRHAGSFFPHALIAHSGFEIPCARMNRKCTYINSTITAGSTNTCSVKKRCRVGGPTTGPPCSSSLTNMPSCGGGVRPAILIVTSVAK